jgi:hypothetical protein
MSLPSGRIVDPPRTDRTREAATIVPRRSAQTGRTLAWNLKDGACGKCGTKIAGVFEGAPGSWGARRLPVRLHSMA